MNRRDIKVKYMLKEEQFSEVVADSVDDLKCWIDVIKYYGTDDYDNVHNLLNNDGFVEMAEGIFCHETIQNRVKVKNHLINKGYNFI